MQSCQVYPFMKTTHPFYACWYNLQQRCHNPSNVNYHHYGARGIFVSKSWQIFSHFYDDMFADWKKGLEIDRKDNNLGYSVENCHWVTRSENCRNTRAAKLTPYDVELIRKLYGSVTNEELGKRFGVNASHICRVYHREKWAA